MFDFICKHIHATAFSTSIDQKPKKKIILPSKRVNQTIMENPGKIHFPMNHCRCFTPGAPTTTGELFMSNSCWRASNNYQAMAEQSIGNTRFFSGGKALRHTPWKFNIAPEN